ncbi:DUF3152 domain-containing protein [Streptomyces sp. NPDC127084]|uniref:DUF3152 domain-containing protein n=1 Tax=Streptomyces sp. NPDC127084 TaxID=3347133 RepID=UPI00366A4F72
MPSRQHRKQSRRRPRTLRQRTPLYATALLAVVGAGYFAGFGGDNGTGALASFPGLDGGGPVSPQGLELDIPESQEPKPGASPPAAEAAAEAAGRPHIPQRGDGEFETVPVEGAARTVGKGTPLRYGVAVEGGLGQNPDSVAREVEGILADKRGWTSGGKAAFQRVDQPPYDFVVRLASPATTDELCGKYGLDTGGQVNCSGGTDVVVNLRRWVLLTPAYQGRTSMYRALIVNHEVGHRLGYGHRGCPGPGRPAPAMMQQIKGLNGCVINAWPYDAEGRPIEGPHVG